MTNTPLERIWHQHVIADYGGGRALLHIDRHFAQESTSARAFDGLRKAGLKVRHPELTVGTIDHGISTQPGRTLETWKPTGPRNLAMVKNCNEFGVRVFSIDDPRHGIVHVAGPHLGFALPGCTYVCGDSHTASCGGVGAWAWGIGTTEVMQVFATQSLVMRKPKTLRAEFNGILPKGIYAKDIILALIGRYGVDAGVGHVAEYAGSAIRALPVEGRMTVSNMSIEFGARGGIVAADDTTFEYLNGREMAPKGELWDRAVKDWRLLFDGKDAAYDKVISIDCASLKPQVTWGNSPQDVLSIDQAIPDPSSFADADRRMLADRALGYMNLIPGQPIEGTPIDVAFIGSCTNGRLSDLRAAAAVARGRTVAAGVKALVVPGAAHVKAAAEAEGLHTIFQQAGFEWREAGCSMCVGAGGDSVAPGQRSISTSNRNFEGRQGPGSRTHLASPAMVAAAAIAGCITDVRKLLN
ncbi:3-isopropylmalate dehydratase large subunit [Acidisphaera sp. S103]|uniref:3-isopropylmalate dehydratase large subunit n=1 Tax=Acidisphaera sp. S103 TaxID=1747223 RepID=UPI00131B75A2|nr:3-isopropylmalate dehydratase large subunit [Acidisphaera sp. S103]